MKINKQWLVPVFVALIFLLVAVWVSRKKKAPVAPPGAVSDVSVRPVDGVNQTSTSTTSTYTDIVNKVGLLVNFKTPSSSGVPGDPTIKSYIISLRGSDGADHLTSTSFIAGGTGTGTPPAYEWKDGAAGKGAGGEKAELFIDGSLFVGLVDKQLYIIGIKAVNSKNISSVSESVSGDIEYNRCKLGLDKSCGWGDSPVISGVGTQTVVIPAIKGCDTGYFRAANGVCTRNPAAGDSCGDGKIYYDAIDTDDARTPILVCDLVTSPPDPRIKTCLQIQEIIALPLNTKWLTAQPACTISCIDNINYTEPYGSQTIKTAGCRKICTGTTNFGPTCSGIVQTAPDSIKIEEPGVSTYFFSVGMNYYIDLMYVADGVREYFTPGKKFPFLRNENMIFGEEYHDATKWGVYEIKDTYTVPIWEMPRTAYFGINSSLSARGYVSSIKINNKNFIYNKFSNETFTNTTIVIKDYITANTKFFKLGSDGSLIFVAGSMTVTVTPTMVINAVNYPDYNFIVPVFTPNTP